MQSTTLPALKGTEKQIAWAERIRAEKLAALVQHLEIEAKRPVERHHPDFRGLEDQLVARARRRVQASWWIDNRADDGLMFACAIGRLIRREQVAKEAN